jgi:hypothetical protein
MSSQKNALAYTVEERLQELNLAHVLATLLKENEVKKVHGR